MTWRDDDKRLLASPMSEREEQIIRAARRQAWDEAGLWLTKVEARLRMNHPENETAITFVNAMAVEIFSWAVSDAHKDK